MTKREILKRLGKLDTSTLEGLLRMVEVRWGEWLLLPEDERKEYHTRAATLTKAFEMGMDRYGREAARKVFPEFCDHENVSQLSEASGIGRSMLTTCLGGTSVRPYDKAKRVLDKYMRLPPGTVGGLLGQLEDL